MPDGILPPTETTAPELAAETADSRLVRHVRRNLVLWSGGTTLVILLILAAALYLAVAGSLAEHGDGPARLRFDQVKASLTGQRPGPPDDAGPYGFLFGGGGVAARSRWPSTRTTIVLTQRGFHLPDGLPDMDAVAAARTTAATSARHRWRPRASRPAGRRPRSRRPSASSPRTSQAQGGETYAVQIVGDRIAEQRTLDVMLTVLLLGGDRRGPRGLRVRDGLRPARARADPRVADQPARRPAAPARVRGRRQPRAADPADRHPEQRRVPRAASRTSRSRRSARRSRTSTTRSAT